jgi:hypothetical protein
VRVHVRAAAGWQGCQVLLALLRQRRGDGGASLTALLGGCYAPRTLVRLVAGATLLERPLTVRAWL